MNDWISILQGKRKRFVDSVKENEFEGGVRQSAVEKYADPVHFIFELIQNAEDQEASLARFTLSDHLIIFEHDGKHFTQGDVDRITGWGQSDKPNQANKIGRFGIGFKSVFVVTDSPEVYVRAGTAEAIPSFRIRDLFVPELLEEPHEYTIAKDNFFSTRFVLRLRKNDADRLSAQIREKFRSFSADVLLFLRSLKRIEWLADGVSGNCERYDRDGIRGIATSVRTDREDEQRSIKRYFVVERAVDLKESEKPQVVKIAFNLDKEGRIVAEDPLPPLHVFFPTEEKPGLKFRLHAPFLLTDNRANIKHGIVENDFLVSECAQLLRDSLKEIRRRNKLSVTFLNVLPIERAAFPPGSIFEPFYDVAFKCLYEDSILLCSDNSYCNWKEARFTRDPRLVDLIPESVLTTLFNTPHKLRWLNKDFGKSSSDALLSFLESGICNELQRRRGCYSAYLEASNIIFKLEWNELVGRFSKSLFEAQTDTWIQDLYSYLDKQDASEWKRPHGDLCDCPIIRLSTGIHVVPLRHDKKPQAFLPSGTSNDYPTVKSSLIREEAALSFIKRIGVDLPDVAARILDVILPKYAPLFEQKVRLEENLADLEFIIGFLKKGGGPNSDLVLKTLDQTPFFYANNAADPSVTLFKTRREVVLSSSELEVFLHGNKGAWFLHGCYADHIEFLRDRLKFTDTVRVSFRQANNAGYVTLCCGHGNHMRGLNRFDLQADVEGLTHALQVPSSEKARIIWNRILVCYPYLIKGEVERSSRQDFTGSKRLTQPSTFGKSLINAAWLPKQGGGWATPSAISLEELPDGFEKNHEVASQLGMKQSIITELASQKKIPPRLLQRLLEAAEQDPDQMEKVLAHFDKSSRPSAVESNVIISQLSTTKTTAQLLADTFVAHGATTIVLDDASAGIVRNPDRYRRELEEQLQSRKINEHPREQRQCIKLRRVWEDANPAVRDFLLQTYQGRCQITGTTFPKRDGKPYFEVWYLISTKEAEWLDEPGNGLCVCPEIWAKLEYGARDADLKTVIDQIVHWKPTAAAGNDKPYLKMRLCGDEVIIKYTENHMLRLQVLVQGLGIDSKPFITDKGLLPNQITESVESRKMAFESDTAESSTTAINHSEPPDIFTTPCHKCGMQIAHGYMDRHLAVFCHEQASRRTEQGRKPPSKALDLLAGQKIVNNASRRPINSSLSSDLTPISCPDCGARIAASYLTRHKEISCAGKKS